MRVGLFGGTFNPIHQGHLSIAKEIKDNFGLDEIIFIPSAVPPHKAPTGVADISDRYEMTSLAVTGYNGFSVSDVEVRRAGPSFTIDTVSHFRSILSPHTDLYFIAGIDAFLEIHTWQSYADLLEQMPFIVMARPGIWNKESAGPWDLLKDYLDSRISEGYTVSSGCYTHEEKKPIFIFDTTLIDISSTEIRKYIKEGRPVASMIPEKVETFIKTKGLYL